MQLLCHRGAVPVRYKFEESPLRPPFSHVVVAVVVVAAAAKTAFPALVLVTCTVR